MISYFVLPDVTKMLAKVILERIREIHETLANGEQASFSFEFHGTDHAKTFTSLRSIHHRSICCLLTSRVLTAARYLYYPAQEKYSRKINSYYQIEI